MSPLVCRVWLTYVGIIGEVQTSTALQNLGRKVRHTSFLRQAHDIVYIAAFNLEGGHKLRRVLTAKKPLRSLSALINA